MRRDYRFKYGQGPLDDEPDDQPEEIEESEDQPKPPPFSPSVKIDMKKKPTETKQSKLSNLTANNDGSLSFNVIEEQKEQKSQEEEAALTSLPPLR